MDYVSPNVREVLGYDPEDLTREGVRFMPLVHPEDRDRVAREVLACFARGESHVEQSYRLRREDGTYRWMRDHTVLEWGEEGGLEGLRGYLVDETDLLPRLEAMSAGDVLIGLPSSGLHTNGYSLARKVCFEVE